MKTILAPVDFSPATSGVVAAAAVLARSLEGRVVLLHVTQTPVMVADYGSFMVDMASVTEQTAKAAAGKLDQLRDQLERDFVKADVVELTGIPVPLIIEQARKLVADYIVIGSHGHTAFYDLMVGSTTAGIVKRSSCPVVIVPPPAPPKKKPASKSGGLDMRRIAGAPHL
jgi:nucleotide-binding universal stress UspA family protein